MSKRRIVTLYRMEQETHGNGPYRDHTGTQIQRLRRNPYAHPLFSEDRKACHQLDELTNGFVDELSEFRDWIGLTITKLNPDDKCCRYYDTTDELLFGFKSIRQLRSWFTSDIRCYMRRCEEATGRMRLVEYRVPADLCIFGDKQVLFQSIGAKVIAIHEGSDIEKGIVRHA